MVKDSLEELWLMAEDTKDRDEWRRRTCVSDLSPEGYMA